MHRWEDDYQKQARTQKVEPAPLRPVVAIRVTSPIPTEARRHPQPWFLVHDPIRNEFIDETIAWLFGSQFDGSKHTWEKLQCRMTNSEENSQKATA